MADQKKKAGEQRGAAKQAREAGPKTAQQKKVAGQDPAKRDR